MSATIKFQIPPGFKPGACAAKESNRFGATGNLALLRGVDPSSSYLAATNGKVLAVVPISVDSGSGPGPHGHMLLPSDLAANGKPLDVEVNGEVRASNGKKTAVQPIPEQSGRFPGIGGIFPDDWENYRAVSIDAPPRSLPMGA